MNFPALGQRAGAETADSQGLPPLVGLWLSSGVYGLVDGGVAGDEGVDAYQLQYS